MFVTPAFAEDAVKPAEGAAPAPAEGHAGTEVAGGGEHGGAFPPFDPANFPSLLLWLAISFGALYILLKSVAMPRIGGIIDDRNGRIAKDLDEAVKLKAKADEAMAAYEQGLTEARSRAGKISGEARDKAKADAEAHRKAAEAELDAKLGAAENRIAGIKASALKDVGGIAEETAGLIVKQLTGAAVSPADIAAAVKAARK